MQKKPLITNKFAAVTNSIFITFVCLYELVPISNLKISKRHFIDDLEINYFVQIRIIQFLKFMKVFFEIKSF